MEKITSFTINHLTLMPGLYVSRKDIYLNTVVTTFDMRFIAPNREPVIDTPALHTIEHLGATFLRNSSYKNQVVYFGPMGCRTGFYLLMALDIKPLDILDLIIDMCNFIIDYEGEIPGAKPNECGNYLDQNLDMAKFYMAKYKNSLLKDKLFTYPE